MVAVILAVALGVAVVVAVAALVALRASSRHNVELAARADGAEAKVAAGLEREAALEERHEALASERTTLESTIAGLEVERDMLRRAIDDGAGEVSQLNDQLAHLGVDLANARDAAREADVAAVAALAQADATRADLAAARGEAEELRAELKQVTAAPAPEGDRPQVAAELVEGLWALERARTERTWRQSVALDPSDPTPFRADADADPARVAIEVALAALREEVGSVLSADWRVDGRLGPAEGLLAVRAAQELLAVAARTTEEGVLAVARDDGGVVLSLRRGDGSPVALVPLVGDALAGGHVEGDALHLPSAG